MGALTLSGAERVLDIGCGTGEFERLAVARFPSLTVVGLDVTPAMVAVAREKLAGCPTVHLQLGQAEALPFGAGCFDAVVTANMLHHATPLLRVMREGLRVLRPDGQFVIVDWCRDFWRARLAHYWLRLCDPTYMRMYRVRELQQAFEEEGASAQEATRFVVPPLYGMMCVKAVKHADGRAHARQSLGT